MATLTPGDDDLLTSLERQEVLPSGQILRSAALPDSTHASCTVLDPPPGTPPPEVALAIGQRIRRGIGTGINLSRLVEGASDRRQMVWLTVRHIAQTLDDIAARGYGRTATGVFLDAEDLWMAADLARHIASQPSTRHFSFSLRLSDSELNALSAAPGLAEAILDTGQPGIIFRDAVGDVGPTGIPIVAANPCVEQHLGADEVCTLASINVASVIGTSAELSPTVSRAAMAARLLFAATQASAHHTAQADELARVHTRIGVGFTGFDTMLRRLGIPYHSATAVDMAGSIAQAISTGARQQAEELRSLHQLPRTALQSVTAVAPAGAISRLADVSCGIAPTDIAEAARVPRQQIRIVAAAQAHVDAGVSATISLPEEATSSQVLDLISFARQMDCRGVSFFRIGTRLPCFESCS